MKPPNQNIMKSKKAITASRTGFLLVIMIFFCNSFLQAQGNKAVYAEFFGNGLGLSANFDCRFTKKENGFGFRAGLGFYPETFFNESFITIPLGINHLAGNGPHYFESGMGVTFIPGVKVFGEDGYEASGVAFMPRVGYRYAQKKRGFLGRVFVSPLIAEGGIEFWMGLGLGFKF